jgi:hypothetical protein
LEFTHCFAEITSGRLLCGKASADSHRVAC